MQAMSEYLSQLEQHSNLSAAVIKGTKINKVLKGMLKLESIPKDDQYKFKERSTSLLSAWTKSLAADAGSADGEDAAEAADAAADTKPETNGVTNGDKKEPQEAAEEVGLAKEIKDTNVGMKDAPPTEETEETGNDAVDEADVSMADAKPEAPDATETKADESAAEAKTEEGAAAV